MKPFVVNVKLLSRVDVSYVPNCFSSRLGNCRNLFTPAAQVRLKDVQRKGSPTLFYNQNRPIFSTIAETFGGGPGKKLRYEEKHLIGYSMEQMYDIVSQTEKYSEFVPWCKESTVSKSKNPNAYDCRLTVGFPPLLERYTSRVTVERPTRVKSVCSDGMLFNHLLTIWSFAPGTDPTRKDTCILTFFVEFEFRHSLHSHLAQIFFDEVIKKMVRAFFNRAETLYGPQSLRPERLKAVTHESH